MKTPPPNPQTDPKLSRLGNPKYYQPKPPCNGCGGEKFDPPQTPAQVEQVLRDHLQE